MKKYLCYLAIGLLTFGVFGNFSQACAQQVPTLSLKDSISVADEALKKADINLNNYFLYQIVYSNSSKGSYWYYTYRPNTPSEYGQVFVKVFMDKTTEVIGGASSKTRY